MRKRVQLVSNHNSEFELDLAPLLAVMVKLVPVLLLSSGFVQYKILESDVPQYVQQAILNQENKNEVKIKLVVESNGSGFFVVENKNSNEKYSFNSENAQPNQRIPAKVSINYTELLNQAVALKEKLPQVFKVELSVADNIEYAEVIKIMDTLHHVAGKPHIFSYKNDEGKEIKTILMFPEVRIDSASTST